MLLVAILNENVGKLKSNSSVDEVQTASPAQQQQKKPEVNLLHILKADINLNMELISFQILKGTGFLDQEGESIG
jgi:hypothetical protein